MFGVDIEKLLKDNPVVQQFQAQFLAMQKSILDLEHRMEVLENEQKRITKE